MTQYPWNAALESQYGTLAFVRRAIANLEQEQLRAQRDPIALGKLSPLTATSIALLPDFRNDVKLLERAEAFAWLNPALGAVWDASSRGLKNDIALGLHDIHHGTGCGWWYFTEPLPVPTNDYEVPMNALLWGLVRYEGVPSLVFTAFVQLPDDTAFDLVREEGLRLGAAAEHAKGPNAHLVTTTKFTWKLDEPFSAMLARVEQNYDTVYGPNGQWNSATDKHGVPCYSPLSRARTLDAVVRIARFFYAACIWLRQDIIAADTQHIERHARKRYERERREPPSLKLIALRHVKRHREEGDLTDTKRAVEWSCRWTVHGHWRRQRYGPGRMLTQGVYINPYVKGPEDKPFREAPPKVYVVMK